MIAPVDDEPVINTTLTCTIQLNDATHAGRDLIAISPTSSGNAVWLAPTAVTFRATPADDVIVCTSLTWRTRSGSTTWESDASDCYDGVNCGGLPEPGGPI